MEYKTTEAQRRAIHKYNKKMRRNLTLSLNRKTDADMIAFLENKENVGGYIKNLVRKEMDKAKKYIHVKFKKGEKQFVFPDACISGFLSLQ